MDSPSIFNTVRIYVFSVLLISIGFLEKYKFFWKYLLEREISCKVKRK